MNDLCKGAAGMGRRGEVQAGCGPSPMRLLTCLFTVLLLVVAAKAIHAQQTTPQTPKPETTQTETQQPGAGAQVHTGTSSGLDADTRIENLLADHQFIRIEGELDQLPARQAQFYRGILANRNNDLKKSIELLEPLIDEVAASGDTRHEKLLRRALAEDYLREGDWTKAATAYQTLETRLDGKLGRDEQDEIEMPLPEYLLHWLRAAAPRAYPVGRSHLQDELRPDAASA